MQALQLNAVAMLPAQDDLIERLGGVDAVAELTGRRKRMVRDPRSGQYHYRTRAQDCPIDQVPFLLLPSSMAL